MECPYISAEHSIGGCYVEPLCQQPMPLYPVNGDLPLESQLSFEDAVDRLDEDAIDSWRNLEWRVA